MLGLASAQDNVVETTGGLVDGGRRQRLHESFRLRVERGGSLVMRVSAAEASGGRVSIGGRHQANVDLDRGDFHEIVVEVGQFDGEREVSVEWTQPVTLLHYWSFGRVL